jgi:NAD(P)-dependent dehydrogenase (short-subunit alcohol dehydrogenase family)
MSYLEEMFGLAGKTALITGGGGVIAGAFAGALLKAGANVSLWDIEQKYAEAAVQRLTEETGSGDGLLALEANTLDDKAVERALDDTERRFGGSDILINCAGGNRGQSGFLEIDVGRFEEVLRLNIIAGLVVPTKAVAARWIGKKKRGNILNMASMSSYIPLSGVWAYDAAKAAVMNLTMATAKEFAPHGIRVNAMAPGFFIGKQNRALLINPETGELTDRGRKVINHTPFGRFGEVSELCGALLFLVNDGAAGFVTGVTLPVDGGYLVDNI